MQELQFSQSLEQVNEDGQTPLNGSQNASSTSPKELENETWATVIEPTTQDTLLDTSIAQLEILTSICTHLSSAGDWYPNEIHWIRQWEQELIENKVARYLQGTNRHGEIELVRANLSCHLADAEFQAGRLDFYVYEHELVTAFSKVSEFEATFQGLCDRADAEIALNAAAQTVVEEANHRRPESALKLNVLRWKHLTTALDSLTAAVEVEGEPQLSQVHLRRGDCEMLRHRLADPPSDYELARKSEKTLLANAEIYYRGAARLASAAEIRQEASVKEAVAATISGQTEKLVTAKSVDAKGVQKVINNMEEEGLLSEEKYYWIGSL
ncbi:MAG: hypothetical protein LQ342_001929 [Letrouitia transgressa]|nr:MAG: hypothetical protein LQ342_001929 [Letrouitia transgressa]